MTVLWEAQRTSTILLFNETTKLACKTMYPNNKYCIDINGTFHPQTTINSDFFNHSGPPGINIKVGQVRTIFQLPEDYHFPENVNELVSFISRIYTQKCHIACLSPTHMGRIRNISTGILSIMVVSTKKNLTRLNLPHKCSVFHLTVRNQKYQL